MINLWEHSLSCAYASQAVAKIVHLEDLDEVFTMGILHDIGKLLLLQIFSELEMHRNIYIIKNEEDMMDIINVHHGKFGKNLLSRWGFSPEYLQIALYHNHLEKSETHSKELIIVHFANLLVKTMGYGQEQSEDIDLPSAHSTQVLQLTADAITQVEEEIRENMETSTL